MTKQEQKRINEIVEKQVDDFNKSDLTVVSVSSLRFCNARVYEYMDNTTGEVIYALMSYRAIVALLYGNVLFDVLRLAYGYTNTSAKHISYFLHDYGDRYYSNVVVYRWRYVA